MNALRKLFGPSREEIWRQLCAEAGADYVQGGFWKGDKVQAAYDEWTITLDTYAVSTGKTTVVFTRLRAPYVNPDQFRFTIYRRGLFSEIGKWLGMQDIEVGHEEFDRSSRSDVGRGRLGHTQAQRREGARADGAFSRRRNAGEERLCAFQAPYTGQPKAFASQFPGRHNQGGNIAFVDGHVRTLPGKHVVEMDPSNVFRGRAIFPPGEVVWRHDPRMVP